MYRIIDNKDTGKTNKLMLLAKEHNAVFVCANPKAMEIKSHAYGIIGIHFISYDEFKNNWQEYAGNIVIDELENFMDYILNTSHSLIGYSISEE